MNSNLLDLNTNVRRVGGKHYALVCVGRIPAMNLQLNLIALLTVVNKMPAIQFDSMQLKLISTLLLFFCLSLFCIPL